MQHHPSEYVRAPKHLLQIGIQLKTDLFIYLPLNKSFIHYRQRGQVLTSEDAESLKKIPEGNILILRSEQNKALIAESATHIATAIKSGNLNTPEVRATAASVLSTVDAAPVAGGAVAPGDAARESLANVPRIVDEMVAQIIDQTRTHPSVQAYESVISSMKEQVDPLAAHNKQVSAMAVLMMMTVGGASMEDLTDIGAAGLVHDVGLSQLPQAVVEKHLRGDEHFNAAEKLVYMRHVDIVLEMLRKNRVGLSPGVLRIVELHHENYDGSGFKGLAGSQIYRPARILRLADDLVGSINSPHNIMGIKDVLVALGEKRGLNSLPVYDPDFVTQLAAAL